MATLWKASTVGSTVGLAGLLIAGSCLALNNGVGVTPAMGWNPYNAFSCDTVESQYHSNAQAVINLGLKTLGYNYVNLDCGWQSTARNSSGAITWNTAALPAGVPALATFVHNLGLNFGVYSDGYLTIPFSLSINLFPFSVGFSLATASAAPHISSALSGTKHRMRQPSPVGEQIISSMTIASP
jgi:hypothetical protein